jgi:predicted TIM-barrel fold metal-dependent hydrolase
MITDSQILIWGADTRERPWPERFRALYPQPLTAADVLLRMDEAGVDTAVLVTPAWEFGKNDITVTAARAHPDRFTVVASIDPRADAAEQVRSLRADPVIRGLRLNLNMPALREMLKDGRVDRMADAAEEESFPTMVFAPAEPAALARMAAAHPGLRMMIDHANLDSAEAPRHMEESLQRILPLSRYPNVTVKVSAFPCFTGETYPFPRAMAALARVVSEFGAARCHWGSDLHRLPCPYADWTRTVVEAEEFTEEEKAEIMGQSIRRALGWSPPAAEMSSQTIL